MCKVSIIISILTNCKGTKKSEYSKEMVNFSVQSKPIQEEWQPNQENVSIISLVRWYVPNALTPLRSYIRIFE